MRFRLYSDLHTEFTKFGVGRTDEDAETVMILAGDIGVQGQVAPTLIKFAKRFKHVFHVLGNHEHYGGTFEFTEHAIKTKIMDLCDQQGIPHLENITVTDMDYIIFDGVKLIGTTLWTNYYNDNPFTMMAARQMNDYTEIETVRYDIRKNLSVPFIREVHDYDFKFIKKEVEHCEQEGLKAFVVTHHAPSLMSVHPKYGNTPLNGCYASDLSEYIIAHPTIKVWAHGHTHTSFDYMVGDTRIVCNPRGYTSDTRLAENANFNPLLDIIV